MKHYIVNGSISHKRLSPTRHQFVYPFFMLNINTDKITSLSNRYFSLNSFNLFSFYARDHFGKKENFSMNIDSLLRKFSLSKSSEIRFITLPRMFGFVFNPISVLLLIEDNKIEHMLAEVHNYNGGRVIYNVKLEEKSPGKYFGSTQKDMYVSPFFNRDGEYTFNLHYNDQQLLLNVNLFEKNQKVLTSTFEGTMIEYSQQTLIKTFVKHTFLTFKVVTNTIYQSILLKLKGLKFNKVTPIDEVRRY